MNDDFHYMSRALELAKIAYEKGEVPVGAVIVRDGEIISEGYNTRQFGKNALGHAELNAIDSACKKLGGWRLVGCTIYVTLEPCPMCVGAIINSRIERLVFGATDEKAGSVGSLVNLFDYPYNWKSEVTSGIMEKECSEILKDFFAELRNKK